MYGLTSLLEDGVFKISVFRCCAFNTASNTTLHSTPSSADEGGRGERERERVRSLLLIEKERHIGEKERHIGEKERHIGFLTTTLEKVEQDSAEELSRHVAVMVNRVVADSGLHSIYLNLPTFTARYNRFLEEYVLVGGRLSRAAVDILEKIPRQFVVEQSDLVKELKPESFPS